MSSLSDYYPPIISKIFRKLYIVFQWKLYRKYIKEINPDNPLRNIPVKLIGNASADPFEFFDHYCAFSFWLVSKIASGGKNILDVGSPKMMNAILSVNNKLSSLVLADCKDSISNVNYVLHDIINPLPFPNSYFDVFTSTVTLPLVGLARYGDKLNVNCLPNFINELYRVMKKDGDVIISMCLGPNLLAFNNGWFLDYQLLLKVFNKFKVIDYLVDCMSAPKESQYSTKESRFNKDVNLQNIKKGSYRVIFLHFKK